MELGVIILVQTLPWGQGWNFWERERDKKRLTHPPGSPLSSKYLWEGAMGVTITEETSISRLQV